MTKKSIEKGRRLKYYPDKFRLFSTSSGIEKPKPVSMSYGEAKQLVHNRSPDYGYTSHIMYHDDESAIELNSITYELYIRQNHKENNND